MKKIVEGVRQFQQQPFHSRRALFEELSGGQKPLALFITCSDSRISPNLLTDTEPGELFVLRNAGNIVPPYGEPNGGEAATIEYAVNVLGVKDIIVCGHSHCGAMAGKLAPDSLKQLPAVRDWLIHAEGLTREFVLDDTDPLTLATAKNVLLQLDHLRTHPSVTAAIKSEQLDLHGWIYRFETGEVLIYDRESSHFQCIEETRQTWDD